MADEVVDPIEALASAHTKRMQEIADEGFKGASEQCENVVATLRKLSGLRSTLLDKALEHLGIEPKQ